MTTIEAIELAKKNDNRGFTFLYETTYQKSYYVAMKYLKNEQLAMDVLQEAYVKAFKSIGQLQDSSKFESWLSRIVANYSLNELRKNQPILFSETENEDGDDISATFEDDRVETQPELIMDKNETSRLVQEMMADLSDEQRVCITMFYMEDMSVKEIAEMLGVSENTVKSRLNYGRNKIKDKVLELEKRGTKLYGVLPIVFFAALLKKDAMACEVMPTTQAMLNALNGAAKSAANSTVSGAVNAAGSAAKTTAKATGMAAKTKALIAGIAAFNLLVGGGVAYTVYNAFSNNENNEEVNQSVVEEDADASELTADVIEANGEDIIVANSVDSEDELTFDYSTDVLDPSATYFAVTYEPKVGGVWYTGDMHGTYEYESGNTYRAQVTGYSDGTKVYGGGTTPYRITEVNEYTLHIKNDYTREEYTLGKVDYDYSNVDIEADRSIIGTYAAPPEMDAMTVTFETETSGTWYEGDAHGTFSSADGVYFTFRVTGYSDGTVADDLWRDNIKIELNTDGTIALTGDDFVQVLSKNW